MSKENSKEWETMLKGIRRELSFTRRTLRWFRQLPILISAWRLISRYRSASEAKKEGKDANSIYFTARLLNYILAAGYFCLDHVFWTHMARLHKNKALVNLSGEIADYFYIIQSILTMTTNCMDMHYLRKQTNQAKQAGTKQSKEQAEHIRQAIHEHSLECIKAFTDMLTAIFFLDNSRWSEPFIGVVGSLGSFISIYRYWKVPVQSTS